MKIPSSGHWFASGVKIIGPKNPPQKPSASTCGRSARVLYARYFSDRIWFFICRKWHGDYLSVHHGAPVGSLGASYRKATRAIGAGREAVRKQGASYVRK